MTEYFQPQPKFSAARLFSEGHGVESNPFPHDTDDHMEFIVEMNKLELEEQQREAQG
jgi:hypothetical protein